jgi:DNA-binding transcriptional MerR regulator
VSGIRTNAAAELLGVSPNTLRSWERRFGYPSPRRTPGGHRQYELSELEALRRALLETHNISSAIQVARQRGEGPSSAARLVDAFDRFDETTADRVMEESLAVRSVERTVEDLLIPALEYELACRWATGWMHAVKRVVPAATRDDGVFLFDSSPLLDVEALHVQALELALRRSGFRVLMLSIGLPQERVARAMRALEPSALVLCGNGATLDVVGRLVYTARQLDSGAPVFEYRDAMPVTGKHSIRSLGARPTEAAENLKAVCDGGTFEVAGDTGEGVVEKGAIEGAPSDVSAQAL